MPYANFYLDNIDKSKNEVHLLYWNRDEQQDRAIDDTIQKHEFVYYLEDSVPKQRKIKAFIEYSKFAKKLIRNEKFDFIVVMHTLPAILIYRELCHKYKDRFILDYRDYTHEKNDLYRRVIGEIVSASKYTFVSSDAFRKYLPQLTKVKTSHNFLIDSLDNRMIRKESDSVIRIRYWGLIRYSKTQIDIIKHIANDQRFEFHFNGREQAECQEVRDYVERNGVTNVFFHGEYMPEERFDFIKDTDIIQNVQDFDAITENAVSNKFYDSALFYTPQLCSSKSFMGKCVKEYGLGLSCFPAEDEGFADTLYWYYKGLDWEQFRGNCDKFVNKFMLEYDEDIDILRRMFR